MFKFDFVEDGDVESTSKEEEKRKNEKHSGASKVAFLAKQIPYEQMTNVNMANFFVSCT